MWRASAWRSDRTARRDPPPYHLIAAATRGIHGVNWLGDAHPCPRAQAPPGIMDAEAILEGAQFA
ncbi:MAG: hypothetical protein ACK5VI_06700, partial [Opitutia bacterium]